MTNLAETSKHLRKRLKHEGIKARVVVKGNSVNIIVPTFESRFSSVEIKKFCTIAKDNLLTFVRGTRVDPINESMLIEKLEWSFYPAQSYWKKEG